jgi:hypothetical protein
MTGRLIIDKPFIQRFQAVHSQLGFQAEVLAIYSMRQWVEESLNDNQV